ncbi:hypothetical protein [Pseudomonas aeruginosa]
MTWVLPWLSASPRPKASDCHCQAIWPLVSLSDVEDELLLSSQFCNFAWLFLASNNAQVSALA